ncbi:MAG: 2-phosphosulfolactate phosphatase [Caldilineaceae bacterium]|nr:2-phosphosulfolactate phosphatase [Caldilineaceae bacterium]
MKFQRLSLAESAQATGTTVVIDVLRAFTSACYAFGAGASEIILVSETEQAFALRRQFPAALLMGEVGGGPIPGFDFSNSPAHYIDCDLSGHRLIQRTSNGTQGVIRAAHAETIMAASFVCAGATARYIQQLAPSQVTFVITAWHADSPSLQHGDEDAACADYLEALLTTDNPEDNPDPASYLARVAASPTGRLFQSNTRPEYPATDLPYCTQLDRFPFALPIQRNEQGLFIMKPHCSNL